MIKKIKKFIPESIKKILRPVSRNFFVKIEKEKIRDLEKYFKLNRRQIISLLKKGGELDASYWLCAKPEKSEVENFYSESPFCVFNHIFWHGLKYQKKLRQRIVKLARGKVLDYGGGTGYLSLKLVQEGFEVEYADIGGRTFEYAKWLFGQRGRAVKMIDVVKENLSADYGTIVCIDVIEHVKDPKKVLKDFSERLGTGGRLIITALHPDISDKAPMHYPIEFNPEEYLESLGFLKDEKEEFLWVKR